MTAAAQVHEIPEQAPDVLKPGASTPFAQWFRCCLPKETTDDVAPLKTRKRHITFDDEVQPQEIKSKEVTVSKTDTETMEQIPDLDDPTAAEAAPLPTAGSPRNNQQNLVTEFWNLIFQMFFLHWVQENQRNSKRIKSQTDSA